MPASTARRAWSKKTDLGRFEYDEIMDVISFYPNGLRNPDTTVPVDVLDELLEAIGMGAAAREVACSHLRGQR